MLADEADKLAEFHRARAREFRETKDPCPAGPGRDRGHAVGRATRRGLGFPEPGLDSGIVIFVYSNVMITSGRPR